MPHQLYEYDLNTEYRQTAWDAYTDKNFSNTGYGESFHQLFLNGVLAGSDAQTLDPRGNLTRAQACKIVSKALYSLAEIGTTLDPVWDESNIEELTVGETKSGELSDYGGKNYCFEADKAGYYMVSTSADKYALYDAGGTRMEPVDEKDGKDVYMVKSAQEMRLYTAGASGAGVTTTVEHAPSGYIAPQEVVFDVKATDESGTPHYLIFDDHPEHVRPCDVIDDTSYGTPEGTMLTMFDNLGPGIYKVFSTHCVDDYLSCGFNQVKNIYLDSVFYNATVENNVKIHSLWVADWNGDKPEVTNIDITGLNWDTPQWTSYVPGTKPLILSDEGGWGGADIMMTFEVTAGTVSFGTVAYHNRSSDAQFNAWKNAGALKAPYETLETIKGIAETTDTLTTHLEYVINEENAPLNQETRLPVTISNIFFDNRELDFFTTHNSALMDGNRWSMVGSSTVPHKYYGNGIKNRSAWDDNPSGDVVPALDRPWTFDDNYCYDISGKQIPDGAKVGGYYTNQTHFTPNEKFEDGWFKSLISDSNGNYNDRELFDNYRWTLFEDRQATFVDLQKTTKYEWIDGELIGTPIDTPSVNPGYGFYHEYNIEIHNTGNNDRWFSYLFRGNKFNISWSVNGEYKGTNTVRQKDDDPNFVNGVEEAIRVFVPKGETTSIKISVSIQNGSNPSAQNAFAIDIPNGEGGVITPATDGERTYNLYPDTLFSFEKAMEGDI